MENFRVNINRASFYVKIALENCLDIDVRNIDVLKDSENGQRHFIVQYSIFNNGREDLFTRELPIADFKKLLRYGIMIIKGYKTRITYCNIDNYFHASYTPSKRGK